MRTHDDGNNERADRSVPREQEGGQRLVRRSTLLRAAGAVLAGGALAACGPDDKGKASGAAKDAAGKGASGKAGVKSQAEAAGGPPPPGGIQVKKMGDLTGPGITTDFEMEATDLGIPAVTPDGRTLFVFGDTYKEGGEGKPNVDPRNDWRAPTGLYTDAKDLPALNAGIKWTDAVGPGRRAEQFLPYEHVGGKYTVLPSDVLTVGKTMYLQVMVNEPLMNVIRMEIWTSEDSGGTWKNTGVKFDPNLQRGLFQLWTWGLGSNGWVYIYSTKFDRKNPVILSRVHSSKILDPGSYEAWGFHDNQWKWGRHEASPILDGQFGEMCLRPMGGKWLFTCFNAGAGAIEGRLVDTPDSNIKDAPAKTLISGGEWGHEDDAHVAQLYGGYVIPGSTLQELHLSVSQWRNPGGWPYHVMHHKVTGAF
ncbi:DUF4185 domain-containing protein [Streptomyces sp. ODS28]|uniref:DUF4185 domain-containing protein n=1 Tax=Streptomyces sp. ODS28 TaxID=3136688 RepID=UPI0031E8006D